MLGLHLDERHVSLGVGDLLWAMWESPTAVLLSLLVLASLVGMVRFAHDASGIGRVLLGLAHSTLQVAWRHLGNSGDGGIPVATGLLGLHGTEAYAPLHHQDQKHFLRLHIQADGALTVYPIGVDRVGRKWTLRPDAPAHAP